MFTESYRFTHLVAGRQREVKVDPDLLTVMWNGFEGPQTPEAIVRANIGFIDRLIAELANLDSSDPIVLTGAAYEEPLGD